jgi:hypothetical protein
MKKRILCLVLVLAMLLPVQVFAASVDDTGASIKVSPNVFLTKIVYYRAYYSSMEEVPSTYEYSDIDGFSGTLRLKSISRLKENSYVASYSGQVSTE